MLRQRDGADATSSIEPLYRTEWIVPGVHISSIKRAEVEAAALERADRTTRCVADVVGTERGNLQGARFWAVAAHVYELGKDRQIEWVIPTEWLLQDIRD